MDRQRRDDWPNLDAEAGAAGGDVTPGGGRRELDAPGGVTRELQELGRQLANTTRAAWQSEQRQEIQQELTDGLRLLRDQLTEAVGALRTNPRAQTMTQSMKEQVGKAAETTRATELVDDVRTGLTGGLRELNDQLQRLAARLEHQGGAGGAADAATSGSAVSSVGGAQTAPSTPQVTTGEHAGRTGATAGTIVGGGLIAEEPALAPEQPIVGASQAQLERFGRGEDEGRPDLPGEPESRPLPPRE